MVVCCLTSSGIYLMHNQDKNRFKQNRNERKWDNRRNTFWLPLDLEKNDKLRYGR